MRPRPPPVVALALSFGLGCAVILSGAPSLPALALFAILLLPIALFLRPAGRRGMDGTMVLGLLAATLAGGFGAHGERIRSTTDCRLRIPDGWSGTVTGRFLAAARGDAVPFEVTGGLEIETPTGNEGGVRCRGRVRSYPSRGSDVRPGVSVRARGEWRTLPRREWTTPETAGYLVLESVEEAAPPPAVGSSGPRGLVLRARGRVQDRLQRLFGPLAPVTEALILARKEGLDPGLRDDFARAGLAHLLAISGFHVGIVAGILLLGCRLAGVGPRWSPPMAALGAWGYVLAIGSPDAAVRAVILLGLLSLGPVRTRPLAALGALATAFLAFLLVDPGALGRVGFQLSFAGTGALILWSRRFADEAEELVASVLDRIRRSRRRVGDAPDRRRGIPAPATGCRFTDPAPPRPPRSLRPLWTGIGAGLAATLGTLPLVAWHFGQVPLLGIPATLVLGPLVALSIPAIFLCLAVDLVAAPLAAFLAGGVGLFLDGVVWGARVVSAIQGDAGWVSRWHVVALAVGFGGSWAFFRALDATRAGRVGRWARRALVAAGGAAGLLLAPVVGAPGTAGTLSIAAVDVGQGDALAIRSPQGRWVLVDTGPRNPGFDAGARRVLPYLRREGAGRLEALVLTHPDLDHIGGAPAVLRSLEVGGVMDPGRVAGKAPFQDALEAALEEGIPWWSAADRRVLELDGIEIRVLHPPEGAGVLPPVEDANDESVVLLLRYGAFQALLTGDAPADVEEDALRRIEGPVQLLKVGHHGSLTSTSRAFVEALRPQAAVISAGFRNRYGHPHPRVLERLEGVGARIFRTDLQGTVVVRARSDGSWTATLPDVPGAHIDPRLPTAYR